MQQLPALGRVYLQGRPGIDSYLPEFVRHSEIFNKQVKNILIKISDLETSHSLPNIPQQQIPDFSSKSEEVAFLKKIVAEKDEQLDNNRKNIHDLMAARTNDCKVIEQQSQKIRILQSHQQQTLQRHRLQKQYLQQRINKIQMQIQGFDEKKQDRRYSELQIEVEVLRGKLKEHGKNINNQNTSESFKIHQLSNQIIELREANGNLIRSYNDMKLQFEILRSQSSQIQQFKNKIMSQQRQLANFRQNSTQLVQVKHRLSIKENQLNHRNTTIQSLNRQISNLKLNLSQSHHIDQLGVSNPSSRQIQFLNMEIQQLRRQVQETQRKESETYQQKLKFQREAYKLTNEVSDLICLKSQLQSRRFQLQVARNQIFRLKSDVDMLTLQSKDASNAKQYFEESLRKSDQEKQDLSMKVQIMDRQIVKIRQLQPHAEALSKQLNEIHQKYLESNKKQSQISLKYEIMFRQFDNFKQNFNNTKHDNDMYRKNAETKLRERQEEINKLNMQSRDLKMTIERLQYQYHQMEQQLAYNQSKFSMFEENILEFQRCYKKSDVELQQIKLNITELQELQTIFLNKQQKLTQLTSSNINGFMKYRDQIRIQHNFKLQKRVNLLNQIVQLIEAQQIQIVQKNTYAKSLQEAVNKYSVQMQKTNMKINSLNFQKQHLMTQTSCMIDKLKYLEEDLERQIRTNEALNLQLQQMRRMHKSTSDRLAQEMQKKVWLQSRLNGGGFATQDIETLRIDRNQALRKMKGILQD